MTTRKARNEIGLECPAGSADRVSFKLKLAPEFKCWNVYENKNLKKKKVKKRYCMHCTKPDHRYTGPVVISVAYTFSKGLLRPKNAHSPYKEQSMLIKYQERVHT